MKFNIAVIPGDGIGPEVIAETIRVLDYATKGTDVELNYTSYLAGGCAIDEVGKPLPEETVVGTKASDAVLLGAVGGEKWDTLGSDMRPENALLGLRGALGLFANLRPAVLFPQLSEACPLKPELVKDGLDILVLRELTGGIYFGEKDRDETSGYDTLKYSDYEIKRIAHVAFKAAMKRDKKVTSVDKANVLESSRVWRKYVEEVALDYPEVTLNHMYVDNAAMQLVRYPEQFDVIVTGNMFGDILSDEAAMITGSIGMLPSASLGDTTLGMYEPVHGSAPDIAGQELANPLATIMSAAMMLKYSLGQDDLANKIEKAVDKALTDGARTKDIALPGELTLTTTQMTDAVIANMEK
ncbi:MAG: 3-isopropylmalate dehydrogenase [Clostridia bacterium]|jgi:3-isopropylmalate dehydrogenase|nr:3-isopropylmalate dehydrogenase [Clostridia bacterium]MBT7122177.1 3-isopropylmalate dehydrogenase [Clostridia bacterium]